jgi:hypothetical protein
MTHRPWFKVIFNPILRKLGLCIVSIFDEDNLVGYGIRSYHEASK